MIITRTPMRISFIGGGTDFPEYFNEHEGIVIGSAINKYSYISLHRRHRFFEKKFRISYSKTELKDNLDEIEHPAVKGCLKYLAIDEPLEINYFADLPAKTGLGSSSSFVVGLIKALFALKEKLIEKKELAKLAIKVEREVIGDNVGWQDQIWASFGGVAKILFKDGEFFYEPLPLSRKFLEQLRQHMLVLFTSLTRFSSEITKKHIENIRKRVNVTLLDEMCKLAKKAEKALLNENIKLFGELIGESWKLKRQFSDSVSSEFIDELYNRALKAGAYGGKLLGAGGGGFLMLIIPPDNREKILSALELKSIEFHFDFEGSKIIYYEMS